MVTFCGNDHPVSVSVGQCVDGTYTLALAIYNFESLEHAAACAEFLKQSPDVPINKPNENVPVSATRH
jgi:hypothetical protein